MEEMGREEVDAQECDDDQDVKYKERFRRHVSLLILNFSLPSPAPSFFPARSFLARASAASANPIHPHICPSSPASCPPPAARRHLFSW
eukprot:2334274-Pyramimonas_sp.AAC.1